MNFALSDEQEFLREAARGALSRVKTIEAARAASEPDGRAEALPDLWPSAVEAGWPGLLVAEEHGGAELGGVDAMLVMAELGRALAGVPLLGHVCATAVLGATADPELLASLASGERRAALVPARPPDDLSARWTTDPHTGTRRAPAPEIDEDGAITGETHWVIDAPGAQVLVVAGTGGRVAVVESSDPGVKVEPVRRFDATRFLGHVRFDGAAGAVVDGAAAAEGWYLAQALLAAEAVGTVETCLEMAVAYAKERFTFGRPIGSYQAVKHELVEILRRLDNARSLMYYAGWARQDAPDEFPLAASAFRVAATKALDHATRANISVHGGIGATWEHDAPYYFRRAALSRRLLGGPGDAADRVAEVLFTQARAA